METKRIHIILSSRVDKLYELYPRGFSLIHENPKLCKLLKISKYAKPFDYGVWGVAKNDNVPSKLEDSIRMRYVQFESGAYKNMIFLVYNIFAIDFLDRLIQWMPDKFKKCVLVYEYHGAKLKPQKDHSRIELPATLKVEYTKRIEKMVKY